MPRFDGIAFIGTSGGNAFMNELLELLEHEVAALGVPTSFTLDTFTSSPSHVQVFIPHEHHGTVQARDRPTARQLRRSIALCVEQPCTPWFELSARIAGLAAAAVDISVVGVRRLRDDGVRAEHLQLGYSTFWDRWHRDESVKRSVDVIHLGTEEPRRLEALASFAPVLWPYETRVLLPPVEAKPTSREDFLTGEEKWCALRSATTLLNIHRQDFPYLEWARVLEAMCNGCVVVSEPSSGEAPLVVGEHFIVGELANLGLLARGVVDDPALARRLRLDAYDFVRAQLPLRPAAERLVAMAESIATSSVRQPSGTPNRRTPAAAASTARTLARRTTRWVTRNTGAGEPRGRASEDRPASSTPTTPTLPKAPWPGAPAGRRGSTSVAEVSRTAGCDLALPRISVIVPLRNHADAIQATLESIVASACEDLELVVLDDASSDGSCGAATWFMERNPSLAGRVLRHRTREGPGRTRNDLVAAARGELVFPVAPGSVIFPTALSRLAAALDRHPEAMFGYSTISLAQACAPATLVEYQPWEPTRLWELEHIDSMAMIRRDELQRLGGYTEDTRLQGWIDHELWFRVATAGMKAAHVPQILGRSRAAPRASLASAAAVEARGVLLAAYPLPAKSGGS